MGFIVLLIVLAVLVFWLIGAYNKLIGLKNQVANAWKQIDVQLKRRHDLIPNLVNTVKGAMDFERGTLEAVIAARSHFCCRRPLTEYAALTLFADAQAHALAAATGRTLREVVDVAGAQLYPGYFWTHLT